LYALHFRDSEFTKRLISQGDFAESFFVGGHEFDFLLDGREIGALLRNDSALESFFRRHPELLDLMMNDPSNAILELTKHSRTEADELRSLEHLIAHYSHLVHRREDLRSKITSPLFNETSLEQYFTSVAIREETGRLLELQSRELRMNLIHNNEFRSLYLNSASFRELYYRNPKSAWDHREAALVEPSRKIAVFIGKPQFSYSDRTKIAAIGILSRKIDDAVIPLLIGGIKNLRLRNSIAALRTVDDASEQVALTIARHCADLNIAEYRIFSAWLLRGRLGKEPAEILARLLCDPETRVHRYAARLFQSREIEPQLIKSATSLIEKFNLRPGGGIHLWHVRNLCRVLLKALEQGVFEKISREQINICINALHGLKNQENHTLLSLTNTLIAALQQDHRQPNVEIRS